MMPVVRISGGSVASGRLADAERMLQESEAALREPLQELHGLLHFYTGIDRQLGRVTNVSVWQTLEDAHQLDSLQAMLAQRPVGEAAGVSFETITNHELLWTITP
jgi:hypothetical protein